MQKNRQKQTKQILKSIEHRLSHLDYEIATEYVSWLDKKTMYFQQSIEKAGYQTQPDDVKAGDVIWVEFGINVGTELSDFKTKGHYAVVIAVDLGNVIVIPLSSREANHSNLTYDLGIIKGLNKEEETSQHSFLKVDAIRSISKRRIGRMVGKEAGKITLDAETFSKVKQAIQNSFLT